MGCAPTTRFHEIRSAKTGAARCPPLSRPQRNQLTRGIRGRATKHEGGVNKPEQ
jgi:hypothetical protein